MHRRNIFTGSLKALFFRFCDRLVVHTGNFRLFCSRLLSYWTIQASKRMRKLVSDSVVRTAFASLLSGKWLGGRSRKIGVKPLDTDRRTFLKYALFGAGGFLIAKYLNPAINMLQGDTVLNEKAFQNFKITETGRQIEITDSDGSEILVIDKERF